MFIISGVITYYFFNYQKLEKDIAKSPSNNIAVLPKKILGQQHEREKNTNEQNKKRNQDSKKDSVKNDSTDNQVDIRSEKKSITEDKSILSVTYILENPDEKYGFDIPAVSLYLGEVEIAQLFHDTENTETTILIDTTFFDISSHHFSYKVHTTYDQESLPKFNMIATQYISSTEIDSFISSIQEDLDTFGVKVLADTKLGGEAVEIAIDLNTTKVFHQPIHVSLVSENGVILPKDVFQYKTQDLYHQPFFSSEENNYLFESAIEEKNKNQVQICILATNCVQFDVKE